MTVLPSCHSFIEGHRVEGRVVAITGEPDEVSRAPELLEAHLVIATARGGMYQ